MENLIVLIAIVILIVSGIFLIRTKFGAMLFSVLDLLIGLTLIGSNAIPASILFLKVPEIVIFYIGLALTIKGIFYLVISFK